MERKLKHLLPFAVYIAGYLVWFEILEHTVRPAESMMLISTPFDALVPFCEIFVIPYFSWFIFLPFGILLLLFRDEEAYDNLVKLLMIGMTVFLLVSTFLPNRLALRPAVMPRNNVFTAMCAFLYSIDVPENVWPSIHVYDTAATALMLFTSRAPLMQKKAWRAGIAVWAALIIAGTLFIKQHSFFDHLTAFLMLGICCLFVLRRPGKSA